MTKFETVKRIISQNGGIGKTADFKTEGLSNYDVANMCSKGLIIRIRHGFYQLAAADSISEEYMLATLLPESIICMESALFHYEYSDIMPREWTVAVSRTIPRTKLRIAALPLKAYYIQDKWLELGKAVGHFSGVNLPVYDRERTICDCFKYRTKMDNEIFSGHSLCGG